MFGQMCCLQWADTDFSTQWCYENFIQHRTMKRARDIRDQLEGLMERVEIEIKSNPTDTMAVRKVLYSVILPDMSSVSLVCCCLAQLCVCSAGCDSRILLPHSKAGQSRLLQDSQAPTDSTDSPQQLPVWGQASLGHLSWTGLHHQGVHATGNHLH